MKNLLACYANCRYNTRCDDLKTELADKTDQAERDINQFLRERGQKPIQIKTLTRGLRFISISPTDIKKSAASLKKEKPARAARPAKRRKQKRKKRLMPVKSESSTRSTSGAVSEQPSAAKKSKQKSRPRKSNAGSSVKGRDGKLYIILEGDSATIVDQHGLMQRMMSKTSSSARYFEAHEVEARIQIVPKK